MPRFQRRGVNSAVWEDKTAAWEILSMNCRRGHGGKCVPYIFSVAHLQHRVVALPRNQACPGFAFFYITLASM